MSEKKKLRTKDLKEDFGEEIKSNDDLDISLTISKSSSSVASQVIEVTHEFTSNKNDDKIAVLEENELNEVAKKTTEAGVEEKQISEEDKKDT